jgi:alkylhydroperoxidase family enzyme
MRPPGIDGLDDEAIADVINAAALFSWANRLMLSIGEPAPPRFIPGSPA